MRKGKDFITEDGNIFYRWVENDGKVAFNLTMVGSGQPTINLMLETREELERLMDGIGDCLDVNGVGIGG